MTTKMEIKKPLSWLPNTNGNLVISGPCSAESPEQLLKSAQPLAESGLVHYIRAGIWKPRTRPNAFEGRGVEALSWLNEIGRELKIPTCTEVATASHVESALKNNISMLWIGARTSTNPFSVQEIADSLKGVDIPVFVKNPINPDINLWIGALERINSAGIEKLGAIHRGFSTYHKEYRNAPMWEIPIQLKTILPDLPLINDPSHISGSRDHLFNVAQKALDLDMDGLMIESHFNPDEALSDAKQQILPKDLIALLQKLKVRSNIPSDEIDQLLIEDLRSKIDHVDLQIIELLANRMNFTTEIGTFKKNHEVTIFQLDRWKEIIETRRPFGIAQGLNPEFIEKLLQLIHDESIRIQTNIFKQ